MQVACGRACIVAWTLLFCVLCLCTSLAQAGAAAAHHQNVSTRRCEALDVCKVRLQGDAQAAAERGAAAGGVPGWAGALSAAANQRLTLARHALRAVVHVLQL